MIHIGILTRNRPEVARLTESLWRWTAVPATRMQVYVLNNGGDFAAVKDVMGSLLHSEQNLGVAGGRAFLLDKMTPRLGDVVIFLDDDATIQKMRWLELLVKALGPEKVGMAGPAGSFVDWSQPELFVPAPVGQCDVVSGWCQAFKAEVLSAGVALDLAYGKFWEEDSDFCMQIREAGWDVACTGGIGLQHMPSQSGDTGGRAENLQRFRAKWWGKGLTKMEGAW